MDLASLVGLVGGLIIVVVVLILDGGSPAELFAHPSAIILIVGGSMAATTISLPLEIMTKLPKYLGIAFKNKPVNRMELIELLVKLADKARREGLLSLEEESKKITDTFLQKGIMMVVDGIDAQQIHQIMENTIEHMDERHRKGITLFTAAGGFSPTFGIIGTVMGLISVLKQLDDPNKLAKSIAGAFLATLWGLLMANLIFLPIAGKLKARNEEEVALRYMLLEGVLAIQAGENPRIVRDKLMTFLPPNEGAEKKSAKAATGDNKAAAPAAQKAKA